MEIVVHSLATGKSRLDVIPALRFQRGNTKARATSLAAREAGEIEGKIWTFDLPALTTCPGARSCRAFCYAQKNRFATGPVQRAYAANLAALKGLRGARNMAEALLAAAHTSGVTDRDAIRLHGSGDFYSVEYMWAWELLAQRLRVYTYTKSFGILAQVRPRHIAITQSVGGVDADMLPDYGRAVIAATPADLASLLDDGWADASHNDLPAMKGAPRIALLKH